MDPLPVPAGSISVDLALPLPGGRLELTMALPGRPVRPAEMLPVFLALSSQIVESAESDDRDRGHSVSCRAGCGACCRQAVPVSEIEARHLRDVVESLPEPRRSVVRERFAAARRRVEEAGLIDALSAPDRADRERIDSLIREYFRLGIPCPFLEDESCSIHLVRPASCREYLVTTPAENCAAFDPAGIRRVPVAVRMSKGLRVFDADGGTTPNHWIPLILAPEWADAHPEEPEARPGTDLLKAVLDRATNSR